MKKHKFEKMAAQGDLLIIKRNSIDIARLTPMEAGKSGFVVAHSETGHDHTLEAKHAKVWTKDDMTILAEIFEETELQHQRDYDTHETIILSPGCYEFRRQREYTPEGWRRVED